MKKTKLITLLSSFSKDEMKRFEKFIDSPYFNNERNFKPLYTIIKMHHPEFEKANLTEEKIFKKLYPGKNYDKRSALSIRVLYSQLSMMAEKFLIYEGFSKRDAFKDSCLLSELHVKKLFDLFLSAVKKIKAVNEPAKLDQSNLLRTHLVESEIIGWPRYRNSKEESKRFDDFNLAEETLIIYFLHHITEINQRWDKDYDKNSIRSALSGKFFQSFELDKFFKSLDTSDLNSDWLRIIYYSYLIEKENNYEEGYSILKKCFFDNYKSMSLSMKNELLIRLMNFCIFQTGGDRVKYNKDYLQYYHIQVIENLEKMGHEIFGIRQIRNFIRISCRLRKFEETEDFLRKYYDYIGIEIRDDCVKYAKATIEFSQNNFTKTLEYLSTINFSISMMVKDLKVIKLKCLYELGYFDSLRSEVDTYRHFLSKSSAIPKSYAESDKVFMIYLIKLSKIRECGRSDELMKIQKELSADSYNDNTKWIIDKINELISIDQKKITKRKNLQRSNQVS